MQVGYGYSTTTVGGLPQMNAQETAATQRMQEHAVYLSQEFLARQKEQRALAEAKSLAEATQLLNRQSAELREGVTHMERQDALIETLRYRLSQIAPQLREKLYAPLWMIPAAQRYQGVPNMLWLATSIALIVAGVMVMVL